MNHKTLFVIIAALFGTAQCIAETPASARVMAGVGPSVPAIECEAAQEVLVTSSNGGNGGNGGNGEEGSGDHASKPSGKGRLRFGPELGLFVPTKNLVRSRFGVDWYSLGLGFGQYKTAPMSGQKLWDVSLISNSNGGNTAYLLPIGREYRQGLTKPQRMTPYIAGEVDFVPTYVKSLTDDVPGKFRGAASGELLGGLDIGKGARIEGGYRWFSDVVGYNFSGATASIGFRF